MQPIADEPALVIADGVNPPGKSPHAQAVHPELEPEKAAVGIHNERADIMQDDGAVPGHEHIAGKPQEKRLMLAQILRQHDKVITVFDRLERYDADVLQRRQL